AQAARGLPDVSRHDRLRALAGEEIGAQRHALDRALRAGGDLEPQRRAGVIMPDLDGIDLVPMGALAMREQEIDRGRSRTRAAHRSRVAEGLAIVSALGMRLELEQSNHLGGGQHHDSFNACSTDWTRTCRGAPPECLQPIAGAWMAGTAGAASRS